MGVKGATLKFLMRETERLAGMIRAILADEGSKKSPNTITIDQLSKYRHHAHYAAMKKLFKTLNVALGGDGDELDCVKEIKSDIKMYLKDPNSFEIVNPTLVQKMGILNELERDRLKLGRMLKEFVRDEDITGVKTREIMLRDLEKLNRDDKSLGLHKNFSKIVKCFKYLNKELGSKKNDLSTDDMREEISHYLAHPREFNIR